MSGQPRSTTGRPPSPQRRPKLAPKPRAGDTPVQLSADEIALVKSLVIYEDAAILVLNKPAGLSSQGGRGQVNTLDEMLWAFAKPKIGRPRLIHRLDRDTSGVILTAKTKPAAAYLGKAMMARRFSKTYHALIAPGPPEPADGEIKAALRREEIGREAYMRVCADDHAQAEASLSRYRTLEVGTGVTLMELCPQTGRMHQLRVHMAHIGRPILGDVRYGGALTANGAPVPRLMLHAGQLAFPHPDGSLKTVSAPWPTDLAGVAGRAGIGLAGDRS
ncbi:MAG: RluA family pseudouridine synthase [Caulobacteraceae bacterium]